MSEGPGRLLEAQEPAAGDFREALLGLASLSGAMDALLARCPEVDAEASAREASELDYALLGLLSIRVTFALTLEALLDDPPRAEEDAEAVSWHRGHLR